MSLDDDVEVVRLATRFSDMSRDEQAEAAFDRILARLEAAEKRAQVLDEWASGILLCHDCRVRNGIPPQRDEEVTDE